MPFTNLLCPMARLMGIDYGKKRVGIAVTDELQLIAGALQTVPQPEVLDFIKNYVRQNPVEAFVLGMPRNLDNTDTHGTASARKFEQLLKTSFPDKPVYLVDERFTSKMAMQSMVAGGMKKKARRDKANLDKISAAIILQSFMESR